MTACYSTRDRYGHACEFRERLVLADSTNFDKAVTRWHLMALDPSSPLQVDIVHVTKGRSNWSHNFSHYPMVFANLTVPSESFSLKHRSAGIVKE